MIATDGRFILDRIKRHHRLPDDAVVGTFRTGCRITGTKSAGSDRLIFGTATTDSVDLDREVVLPEGCDPTHFERNKSVFVDHNYDTAYNVGTMRRVWREGNTWKYSVNIFQGLRDPMADDIYARAQQGGIGASIGFQALDYGKPTADEAKRYPRAKMIIRKWSWVELSMTAMPANLDCQGEAWMPGQRSMALGDLVVKGLIDSGSAARLGIRPEESRRKIICIIDN